MARGKKKDKKISNTNIYLKISELKRKSENIQLGTVDISTFINLKSIYEREIHNLITKLK